MPTPASTDVPKPHAKAIMRVLQIVTYAALEKGMESKGEQGEHDA